jgi:hypothetical protein
MFVQKIFNKAVDAFGDPAYKPAPDGANDGTNRNEAPLLIDKFI